MTCTGWKLIMMQAIVLVAAGSAIGLADSMRKSRAVSLSRATVDVSQVLPGGSTPTPPTATTTPNPTPAPAHSAPAAGAPKPGEPGWQPTPKASLPAGQITLEEGKQLFDAQAAFIDTRRKEEYEAGHIKGAFRMSLAQFAKGNPALLQMVARSSPVVVYCNGGTCDESEAVAKLLSQSGYPKVFVLHDGYPGWKALNHPTETGPGLQAE